MTLIIAIVVSLAAGFAGGWISRGKNQKSADTLEKVLSDIKAGK
jgi:hypothetical protein